MIETTIRDKYYSLLRFHFANPQEDYLAQAADLGRALVRANIPPEEIAELHEDAIQRLGAEFPEAKLIGAANLISQPLMELLMAYGMAFRERLDERERVEEMLRESEGRFRALTESTSDWIWEVDENEVYTYTSPKIKELLGYEPEEIIGKTPFDFMTPEGVKRVAAEFGAIAEAQKPFNRLENENLHKDGRILVLETSGVPIFDANGNFRGYRGIDRDITERKQAEDKIKASLKEKEVLLREIHHRVKNNLQIVSSLLNMQARATKNKDAIAALSESRNRINAMALIHSQLYDGGDLSAINMKGFMDKLRVQLLQIYSVPETKISLVIHAVECSLSISIAVPVGLIVNELLTNAFKHAFVNRKVGRIEVSLGASEKGAVNLTVSDDGVGLPEGFDVNASKTLGLHVVKILAEDQLLGNLECRVPKLFRQETSPKLMVKLTDKKIKWAVEQVINKGESTEMVAAIYGVSRRRIQQLVKYYRETGKYPMLDKNRRPKTHLSDDEKQIIEDAYNESFLGARLLRYHIQKHYKRNISHNKIHQHLLEVELARHNRKKQKKRKRCRYERKHSLSLVHADWLDYEGTQVIAYEDDASRKILAIGEFTNATTNNAIGVFKRAEDVAMAYRGTITAVNTDRGTQFYASGGEKKKEGVSRFKQYLNARGVKHIPSKRNNPQTNGKIERWFQEYRRHRWRFDSAYAFAEWYNNRVHGALDLEYFETPNEAFIRKMRCENTLGMFFEWCEKEVSI